MRISEVVPTFIELGITTWTLCFSNYPVTYNIIIILVSLVCYLFFWLVRSRSQNLKLIETNEQLTKANEEITQKHMTLKMLFDKKRIESNFYKDSFNSMGFCIEAAMQSSEKDRLAILHSCFWDIKGKMSHKDNS